MLRKLTIISLLLILITIGGISMGELKKENNNKSNKSGIRTGLGYIERIESISYEETEGDYREGPKLKVCNDGSWHYEKRRRVESKTEEAQWHIDEKKGSLDKNKTEKWFKELVELLAENDISRAESYPNPLTFDNDPVHSRIYIAWSGNNYCVSWGRFSMPDDAVVAVLKHLDKLDISKEEKIFLGPLRTKEELELREKEIISESKKIFDSELPQNLEFQFCEVSFKRKNSYATITLYPEWRNAQVPPPKDFDKIPQTVLISMQDFAKIRSQLKQIDFAPLHYPKSSDLRPTPPDMSHSESLQMVVNGKTIIQWSRSYKFLIETLRKPLEDFASMLRKIHKAHLDEPIIPNNLSLTMAIKKKHKIKQYELKKQGVQIALELNDGSSKTADVKKLNQEEFKLLWKDLIQLKVLDIEYATRNPYYPYNPPFPDSPYRFNMIVDGVEAMRFSFILAYYSQKEFNAVWRKLESIWQSHK